MRKWRDKERHFDIVLEDKAGNSVRARVELENVSRLIAMSDYSHIVSSANAEPASDIGDDYMKIKDQVYLGTVKSLISDSVVDVYYITRDYEDIVTTVNGDEVIETMTALKESFFLVIPSTVFLGEYGLLPDDGNIILPGVVSGVDDGLHYANGIDASYVRLTKGDIISTYLTDDVITPTNMHIRSMTLPGLTTDTSITRNTIYTLNGEYASRYGISQFIVLDKADELFASTDSLLLGKVKSSNVFGKFNISKTNFHPVGKYSIAIPFNF